MKKVLSTVKVLGGDARVEGITDTVKQGDVINIGSLDVKVHFTPCHTTGHVLYEIKDSKDSAPASLFTGDTLFIGGCGRFFEGTAEQMYHNLCEVIASLPHNTKVYCGHEYTVKNLEFAATIEPSNEELKQKLAWAKTERAKNIPTVPSTVAEELSFNPFMRVTKSTVATAVGLTGATPVDVMRELRKRKDAW